ncbi:MAG: SDR family NAD(P)-dependent oxidoreductase [Candidatus Symbiobacter sp.]|nr:SDR family NAD(P)-dependent oxidoreductase [Candidatus Symbiobacter sp.]
MPIKDAPPTNPAARPHSDGVHSNGNYSDGKRVALITGASSGIGAAVAVALARIGIHVVLTGRNQAGLEAVDDRIRQAGIANAVTLVPLDLRHGDDIDRMVTAIFERFGRLDILIGNAGTLGGSLYPVGHIPQDRVSEIMAVNFAANWRLIRIAEPLLRAAPAGRAVFTTCGEAQGFHAYYGVYAASKAALEAMVRSLAAESQKSNLRVNMVDPGIVATPLRRVAFPGEDQSRLVQPDQVAPIFVDLVAAGCRRHGQVIRFA